MLKHPDWRKRNELWQRGDFYAKWSRVFRCPNMRGEREPRVQLEVSMVGFHADKSVCDRMDGRTPGAV